jgi:hypothetical protein
MKNYILNAKQTEMVKDALREIHEQEGEFDIDVCIDNITVTLTGDITIDGHVDDDYFTGTGAWVEDYRDAHVEVKVSDEYCNFYAADDTERMAEKYLNEPW